MRFLGKENPRPQAGRSKSLLRSRFAVVSFLVPSMLGVFLFILIPFLDVVRRSFFSAVGNNFVGLANYQMVFANEAFRLAAKNSLLFLVVCIPLLLLVSLLIALALYRMVGKAGFLKTSFLLPMAVPVASVVLVWQVVFDKNGYANLLLTQMGLSGVDWMGSGAAFWVLVGSYIWKNLGYSVILWLAGLGLIPEELYEAARVDGANAWQRFRYVTLPQLLPTLYTVGVLAVLNSFKVFREAYLVAGSYPDESMYLLQHLFSNWFTGLAVDKLSAGAVLLFSLVALLVWLLQKAWDRQESDG